MAAKIPSCIECGREANVFLVLQAVDGKVLYCTDCGWWNGKSKPEPEAPAPAPAPVVVEESEEDSGSTQKAKLAKSETHLDLFTGHD